MAIGKNKKAGKSRKGGKKKYVDPMSKKEWYDFKAPYPFESKSFGKTCVTRTIGTKISTERIKGRVVETSLADLKSNSDHMSWRKVKLFIEDVEGRYCRTTFYGMDITKDKLCQYIKKWQSLIEAYCDVKTKDGYILRVFIVGFTTRVEGQITKKSYTQREQAKKIRRKMIEEVTKEANSNNLSEFVNALCMEHWQSIVKACRFIYPLKTAIIKKVKMLKKPKLDVTKLNELFTSTKQERGTKAEGENEEDESKNLLTKGQQQQSSQPKKTAPKGDKKKK